MDDDISQWFWPMLDAYRSDAGSLAIWLETATREQVETFQLFFEDAAAEIAEYWEGPVVDGVPYSEDDTEDLCLWTVSRGRTYWQTAVSGGRSLVEIAREHEAAGGPAPEASAMAYTVYERRFGTSLTDRLADAD